jgi:hypothetical protein
MRTIWAAVALIWLIAGCSAAERASLSAAPTFASAGESTLPASTGPSPPEVRRRPLPPGFPVLPGAIAVEMPSDDPGLIGLWESEELGSAAYDFYVGALPAAGYPIVGLYPGGAAALIRFESQGEVWQMVAHGMTDGRVAIEIRLDRP